MDIARHVLVPREHPFKIGSQVPPHLGANIHEDTLLVDTDGTVAGLFIKQMPEHLLKWATLVDRELRSDRVPKTVMDRMRPLPPGPNGERRCMRVKQYSAICGSLIAKPHMKRFYRKRSSVHRSRTADVFVTGMLKLGKEAFEFASSLIPTLAASHQTLIDKEVNPMWKFTPHFTSTISNCNIAVDFHQDHANLKGAFNIIITKRKHALGGNIVVPDYGLVFDQTDGSMLVYPAWRNLHGVTPIRTTHPAGYRNTHVWYALNQLQDE